MPQLPEVVPESTPTPPSSRWQSLVSMLLLFLAVVAAHPGRRDIAAAAGQLVQWVTGEAPAASDSTPTPTPATPSAPRNDLRTILEQAELKQLAQQRKIEELETQINRLSTSTTGESPRPSTAPAAETNVTPAPPARVTTTYVVPTQGVP